MSVQAASPAPVEVPRRHLGGGAMVLAGVLATIICGLAATRGLLIGVLAVGAVSGALAIVQQPWLGGYVLVGTVPVLSGIERGVPVPGLRISEVLVVGIGVLVLGFAHRSELQRWTKVDGWACAYAVGSFLLPLAHVLARGDAPSVALLGSMLLPLQFWLLYRTVCTALPSPDQRVVAARVLLCSSLLIAAVAVVQQLDVGPARDVVQRVTGSDALASNSYAAYARATGLFQHWHPLAGYETVIILVSVALLLDGAKRVLPVRWLAVVLMAALVGLMLSVTFVAMLGVAVGTALLCVRAGRTRELVRWGSVAVLAALVAFSPMIATRIHNQYVNGHSWVPQTIQKRLDVWQYEYAPVLRDNALAGYGPGLPPGVEWTHTESEYVTVLLRGGVPLLLAFGGSLLALSSALRKAGADDAVARGLHASVVVLWAMLLLYPYLTSSGLPQPLWALAGIVLGTTAAHDRAHADQDVEPIRVER